ncbi:hypothetical protein ABEB36_014838 [Hypothenemus hampei]|uniref:Uncharacterized protein n=1 Tax=Hypothenemus hampei TaxID=57062 RepID=A0ABD1E110_HYPHA
MNIMLSEEELELKRKIVHATSSIRKKYLALKLERHVKEIALNKVFKPLTNSLQKIVQNTSKSAVGQSTKKNSSGKYKISISTPISVRKDVKESSGIPSRKSVGNYQFSSNFLSINNDDNDEFYDVSGDDDDEINKSSKIAKQPQQP